MLLFAVLVSCSSAAPVAKECIGVAVDDPNGQKNDTWAKQIDCTTPSCVGAAICDPWKTSGYLEITSGVSACPNGDCTCANCNCERIPQRFTLQYYGQYESLPACMTLQPASGQNWRLTQDGCAITLTQRMPNGNAGPVLGPFLLEPTAAHQYKLEFSRKTQQTSPDGFGVEKVTSEFAQRYVMKFDNDKGTLVGSLDQTFTDFVGNNTETVATCGFAGVP